MKTNISIALCTFNGERTIEPQLASLARQTRLPDELIICDDGSSDATVDVVERFAAAAAFPVRIQRNVSRLGTNRNFEQAISLCGGELIFLADQDDVWSAAKVASLCDRFDADPQLACIFTNARLIDGNGTELPDSLWRHINFTSRMQDAVHHGGAFEVLAADNYATGATMAFRAAWRETLLPIPPAGIVHDDWIALVLSALARVDCDERRLIDYRQHEAQQIGVAQGATTVRRWVRQSRSTGRADYAARAVRLELALERVRSVDPRSAAVRELEQRISHQRTRAALPSGPMARLSVVAGEVPRYLRYSNHIWSIAKDLFGR